LPDIKVIGKDTVCTVSISDVRAYNHAMSDLDACNELADTLYAQKERYKSISSDKSKALAVSDSLAANYKVQATSQKILADSWEKDVKRKSAAGKWLKGIATGLGVLSLVEFIYIGIQSIVRT
jgi:hypothetical protein